MSGELEVRTNWKVRAGGFCLGQLMRIVGRTLRVELRGEMEERQQKQSIHVLWHNRIFPGPVLWRQLYPERSCHVLTSASKDGVLIEEAMKVFRIGAVRGSTSRRGKAALLELVRLSKRGGDLVVTPDGPRGPRYHLQGGVVKLAQMTGLPVVPMRILLTEFWTLKTWDHFRIPKPFSKVVFDLGEVMEVPRKMSGEEFEDRRQELERRMRLGITDLPEEAGGDDSD